nr:PREDICTED: uncharacterized protein LOC109033216 [Bemisia tabaci]
MALLILLFSFFSEFAADEEITTITADKKTLEDLMHEHQNLERWRHEKLLEAREAPQVMENKDAVEFLNGLEEIHYAYMNRHEYFETVLRMIRIHGKSLRSPSETIKKILNCVKDLETTWKKHESLLLGKNCQKVMKTTEEPFLDLPQIKELLPAFAKSTVQYYEIVPLFEAEVEASPLAKYVFTS